MNFLNNIKKALLIAAFALVALPAALAYSTYGYNLPVIGAYTTEMPYAQGFYDYVSPPISLPGYSDYNIFNVRNAIYPEFPAVNFPNYYRPYYGDLYANYGLYTNTPHMTYYS